MGSTEGGAPAKGQKRAGEASRREEGWWECMRGLLIRQTRTWDAAHYEKGDFMGGDEGSRA